MGYSKRIKKKRIFFHLNIRIYSYSIINIYKDRENIVLLNNMV
jgi:hypothetical protein